MSHLHSKLPSRGLAAPSDATGLGLNPVNETGASRSRYEGYSPLKLAVRYHRLGPFVDGICPDVSELGFVKFVS